MLRLNAGGVGFIRKWIESQPEPRLALVIDTWPSNRDPKGVEGSLAWRPITRPCRELKALADEKGAWHGCVGAPRLEMWPATSLAHGVRRASRRCRQRAPPWPWPATV